MTTRMARGQMPSGIRYRKPAGSIILMASATLLHATGARTIERERKRVGEMDIERGRKVSDKFDMDTAIMNDKIDESIADYSRRVQLAIDGFEHSENVSTWVVKQHLIESQTILAEAQAEIEQRKAELEGWKSRNVYPLEYREALEEIAALRKKLAKAETLKSDEIRRWLNADCATLRTQLAEAQAEVERLKSDNQATNDYWTRAVQQKSQVLSKQDWQAVSRIFNDNAASRKDITSEAEQRINDGLKKLIAGAIGDTEITVLRTKLAEAQAEINLWRESADSMKAAWNAACADIAALRTKLADARELLVRTHWCRDEATCEVCRWIAANREKKTS